MQHKVKGTLDPDRLLYIYSAHDQTITNLLQALNVFNGILVPYASAVLVELRELHGSYYTTVGPVIENRVFSRCKWCLLLARMMDMLLFFRQVFYKNSTMADSYLLQIPGCECLCPLDQFMDLIKDVIPDDVSADCAEEVEEEEYEFEVPVNGTKILHTS
ncbi:hypothetical protein PR048_015088 [Dryococelus australis]|uniref:acid phosphatase n=1 Tax=Dryococelus australis TaxID=614101 RepID=A0ABQ9HFY8_9NEOP|nr:hypothetical protein PR048_015088 [Dryococelus australis]